MVKWLWLSLWLWLTFSEELNSNSFGSLRTSSNYSCLLFKFCYRVNALNSFILGWCKSNCCFALLNFAVWHGNTFLNNCGYVIHHFNAHFSLYVFLLMTLLAVCFIFILDNRTDVRQKTNLNDFFFNSSSKWVVKRQRQLATSTTHLAQELLMNVHCSGGSRSFAKEMRALRWGVQWPAIGSWQWLIERIIAANPLTTTREVAEELSVNRSSVVRHLKQIGKVKNLNKWGELMSCPKKKKKIFVLKCCLLLFYAKTMNHFSIGLLYTRKSGFYKTTWDDQLSCWIKKKLQSTSQSQSAPKKGHGHCLVVCCQPDPL